MAARIVRTTASVWTLALFLSANVMMATLEYDANGRGMRVFEVCLRGVSVETEPVVPVLPMGRAFRAPAEVTGRVIYVTFQFQR